MSATFTRWLVRANRPQLGRRTDSWPCFKRMSLNTRIMSPEKVPFKNTADRNEKRKQLFPRQKKKLTTGICTSVISLSVVNILIGMYTVALLTNDFRWFTHDKKHKLTKRSTLKSFNYQPASPLAKDRLMLATFAKCLTSLSLWKTCLLSGSFSS
jgi:hypothetical protein